MTLLSSMSMFFLSFAPLWVSVVFIDIISILNGDENLYTEWISIACIVVLTIVSLIVLLSSLSTKKRSGVQRFYLTEVQEEKTITAEYLLSYILPLFAFDFTNWIQVVLFLIYFLTLGYLCIRHNHLSVNIVLEIFQYRFYRCDLTNEDGIVIQKSIISREKLIDHKTEIISTRPLNNEYSLDLLDWNKSKG